MAIPFHLPTDEETEDIYRRIDQIILDLYEILRQLLRRQTAQVNDLRVRALTDEVNPVVTTSSNSTENHQTSSSSSSSSNTPPLPDLVLPSSNLPQTSNLSSRKPPVPPPRRRRRRHHHHNHQNNNNHQQNDKLQSQQISTINTISQQNRDNNIQNTLPSRSWLNVGFELRQIAEEFTIKSQCEDGVEKKSRHEIKASSLFSLLVPAPITGSIWTTVIILVGWRMLIARQR
ncbi:hypothetical protein O3M35_011037 [Rhynocoris fuscipes]|uniref:Uncharacterized protein n=1 Tax=Rhynocoris fuscipes TaxID=488301 RepID=A0AAW1CX25_9HEMI